KLAKHAEQGTAEVRPQADEALREQVRGLLRGWTLEDPNPEAYGTALHRMAAAAPVTGARSVWQQTAEPLRIVQTALETGVLGFEPLLDALGLSESRTTRRGLLDRLTRAPRELGPVIATRLTREIPWYVTRNLLLILDGLPALPDGFRAAAFIAHEDARVRREALKVSLK